MTRSKFYKYASIILLLLNITLVTAFLITKPKNRPRGEGRLNAKDLLKMDDAQHDLFLINLEKHKEEVNEIREKQIEVLRPYLYSVGDSTKLENNNAIINTLKELEGIKLTSMYNHLKDLQDILSEDQLPLFDSFLKQRLDDMTRRDENRRPPMRRENENMTLSQR